MITNPENRDSKTDWPKWRKELHNIIFEADTPGGKLFDVILLIFIVLSIVAVMLETVEGFDTKYHREIVVVEWIITIAFTLEYIARILAVKKPWRYVRSFYGLVDLFSTLPAYLSLFVAGSQGFIVIRALRLLRVFRVLKLVRFSNASDTIIRALTASKYKIIVFMISVVTMVTIVGALMYLVESPTNDGFSSIPESIYWAIVTLTTVGYGDISPETPFGKLLASIIMILGYGIIAVPTGIVSAEMSNQLGPKQKRNPSFNKACLNCGAENHPRGATFCHRCADELED